MTDEGIKRAVSEAKRFVKAAEKALGDRYDYTVGDHRFQGRTEGKASGACRRASMDLTRALAEMRRPE